MAQESVYSSSLMDVRVETINNGYLLTYEGTDKEGYKIEKQHFCDNIDDVADFLDDLEQEEIGEESDTTCAFGNPTCACNEKSKL